MFLIDAQLSASEVLRIFHHDEPALFLGSAFTTVGIVTGAFCLLRRRFDALLVWLGVFAFLYGQRMWFDTGLLHVTLAGNEFFARLRWAVDFIVPIPAFLFFQAAGLMARRGKLVTAILSIVFLSLAVAVFVVGRLPLLHTINNVLVIAALLAVFFGVSYRAISSQNQPGPTLHGDQAHPAKTLGWVDTKLYFGLGPVEPAGKSVSESQWRDFLDKEVTPRFPAGLSVVDVYGQWQGKNQHAPERLRSKMLVIDYPDILENRDKIEAIRTAWKQRTGDQSVLRVTEPVDVSF